MQTLLEQPGINDVLVPQIVLPDIKPDMEEAQAIASCAIQVIDSETNEKAICIIKKADEYMNKVDAKFASIKEPLSTAVKSLNSLIKELKEPAEATKADLRKQCLEWKLAEDKRIKEEQARLIEEAKKAQAEWTPLDDTPEPQIPTFQTLANRSGAGTRKSPWKARITDMDKLWEAAIKDPRYREYFIPDQKALDAKARSMGAMFSIPGVEAYQEQNLVIR